MSKTIANILPIKDMEDVKRLVREGYGYVRIKDILDLLKAKER